LRQNGHITQKNKKNNWRNKMTQIAIVNPEPPHECLTFDLTDGKVLLSDIEATAAFSGWSVEKIQDVMKMHHSEFIN
jgi:hypothetical protein